MTNLPRTRSTTTPLEAAVVVTICFGLSIVASLQAMASGFRATGAFTDASLLWLIASELVLAGAALAFLHLRGFAIASLVPTPTLRGGIAGVALFFGAWLIGSLLVAPFAAGQPEQPIDKMVAEATLSMPIIVAMALVNGAFEEIFLLGFLARALRGFGLAIALGVPTLVRVSYHLYQGPLGALWVFAVGLVFALYYARSVQLWPPVFAHVLWDIVPFVLRDT
ncbi:CPBP family intramembrane glutamic endopeptidase [Roseateles sp. P5_E7]